MKNLIMLYFLLISASLFGQECKVSKTVDEFTGSRQVVSDKIKLTPQNSPAWGKLMFARVDSIYFLYLHAHTRGVASVQKGEFFYIKFDDGEVLKLESLFYAISDANYQVLAEMAQGVVLTFALYEEELQKVISTPIEKCRIATSRGELVFEANAKIASKIQDCAKYFHESARD